MIEDTVDKYIELTNEVEIQFSSNTVMTALNIGQITDLIDWLYKKIGNCITNDDWFNLNPITKMKSFDYIDFRNLSKETKNRIKRKWDSWEQSNPIIKSSPMGRMLDVARFHIEETGGLDKHLTKELMLEKHYLNQSWKHFGEDLKNLEIEEK